jgi:hypothetical protein
MVYSVERPASLQRRRFSLQVYRKRVVHNHVADLPLFVLR